MEMYPDMQEAANVLIALSQDKEIRELAEIRQYHRWAYQFSLDQEKAEGRAEGRVEIARNLLANGFSLADVVINTGLSEEEVKRLG